MKLCPECFRDYPDETLKYCLDDGSVLLDGPATADRDEPKTAKLQFPAEPSHSGSETSTRAQFDLISRPKRKSFRTMLGLGVAAVAVAVIGYGAFTFLRTRKEPAVANLKIQPLTASGETWEAAISPDGKYLAYTEQINETTAVWIRQLASNNKIQIVPPTPNDYFGLRFSPDGGSVYYAINDDQNGSIYRVSSIGGTPARVISDVDGGITFSPDGKQFAFERYSLTNSESSIMIVNADGSGARKLVSKFGHEYFSSNSLSWSPDGKFIACASSDDRQNPPHVMAVVDVATGEVREFGKQRLHRLGYSVWRKDQSGLLFAANDSGGNIKAQVWEIAYPGGDARQILHDFVDHMYLSITDDGETLVDIQRDGASNVWLSADSDPEHAQQLSRGRSDGNTGMTLTPDGRIVYVSRNSGATEIWIVNQDGSNAKQLTNDGVSKYTPTVSGDGKYIVFVSEKDGDHLWRMGLDGGPPVQLTKDNDAGNPRSSPDGQWIYHSSYRSGQLRLWRVSINGGEPQLVSDVTSTEPDVSPDGKYVACFYMEESGDKKWKLGILPADGGSIVKTFEIPATVSVDSSPQWTWDGKGITYIDWLGDASNLWLQSFGGGPAKQLTHIKQGFIYRREWTRDGKKVAIVRGTETSDAAVITGF